MPKISDMQYRRSPIEIEAPEQLGYETIKCNLSESSVRDLRFGDLNLQLDDLVLAYTDHLGLLRLRSELAENYGVEAAQVMVTTGASAALFMVASSLLNSGDKMIVVRPNYASNIETPRAIGAQIDYFDLEFQTYYRLDVDRLLARITPQTRLVSITNPHNPTGSVITEDELERLVAGTREKKCFLLVDETYRDLCFAPKPRLAASLDTHVISVSSMSKAYGLPGIRIGWLISQDPKLYELFLAAKEQIFITGSILDEEIAAHFIENKEQFFPKIQKMVGEHFLLVKQWLQQEPKLKWVEPMGGVFAFPQIVDPQIEIEEFYQILHQQFGTYVGPGHWFEQPKNNFRIGYAWPTTEELTAGLKNISQALEMARK